jgi:RNA polymerase subunit RPABC4/transcription elongation factor Spt4
VKHNINQKITRTCEACQKSDEPEEWKNLAIMKDELQKSVRSQKVTRACEA